MDEDLLFKYLTEPVLGINLNSPKLKLLLNACEDHQILTCKPAKESQIHKVFERVNIKLGDPARRHVGILLLKTFLPQCYDEIFAQHGLNWIKQCIDLLRDKNVSFESVVDCYELLASLFDLSGKFDQLNTPMTKEVVPAFFNAVRKGQKSILKVHKSELVFYCIKPLMKHYAAACQYFGDKYVWNLLWKTVYGSTRNCITIAGECMCYFTREPMEERNNDPWPKGKVGDGLPNIFSKLCATASELLLNLFQNVNELRLNASKLPRGYDVNKELMVEGGDQTVLQLEKDSVLCGLGKSANCFVNVLGLMEAILRNETTFPKRLNISQVLTVVFRALSVNILNIRNSMGTVEHIVLLSLLPTVQVAVYNFLRCFVTCYDGLLGYGFLFCNFVMETLQWTEATCFSGNTRRYECVREAAYLFLEAWVIRAKAASCIELYAEDLLVLLLQDVVHKKEEVTLQMKSETGKVQQYLTKKKLLNPQANAETCAAALRALCAVIEASGSLLKTHHHVMLQEAVVTLLLEVRRNNLEYMPYPYSSPECRLQLYRVLLALTLHPNGSWPAPLQFAMTLFPYGQTDPSLEVSSFCLLANATTRQMVHPSRSNAQFPISLEDMRASAGLKENPLNFSLQGQILRGVRVNGESKLNAVERRNSTPNNGISPKVAKRKLQTQTSITSLNRTEDNTPELSTIKNSSPASQEKKLVPVVNVAVNCLKNDLNSNTVQKKKSKLSLEMSDNTSVSPSSERPLKKKCNTLELSTIKNSSPASEKKKLVPVVNVAVNGLENGLNSNVVQKKKSRLSLEMSKNVSVSPSSERPLKKKRSLSESSLGSLDQSGSKNMLRLSLDSWTVVDLPQRESSKKKKKKTGKKKVQANEVSVDVESPSKKKQRVQVSEIPNKKIPISSNIWNVSVTESHKISPKKSFTKEPVTETQDPAQQERLREGKTSAKAIPVPYEVARVMQPEKIIGKGKSKGETSSIENENTELSKERAEEEEMVNKNEKEEQMTDVAVAERENVSINQRPSEESSSSQSPTLPLIEPSLSSVDKSEEKQPPTPVKDSNPISEDVIKISDVKPQEGKILISVNDSETSTGGVDIPGDKETRSPSRIKPQESKPSTPVKESKVVSEEHVKISDTVTIEETPSGEVGSSCEKPTSVSAARNAPVVDLADSDNSCSIVSLDSDGKEEQSKKINSELKESAVNTSFEDCQDPDAAAGMDAVVESPQISLEGTMEETKECAADGTSEKPSKRSEDSKKDSDTDEEDILTTFVDIVSTNSE